MSESEEWGGDGESEPEDETNEEGDGDTCREGEEEDESGETAVEEDETASNSLSLSNRESDPVSENEDVECTSQPRSVDSGTKTAQNEEPTPKKSHKRKRQQAPSTPSIKHQKAEKPRREPITREQLARMSYTFHFTKTQRIGAFHAILSHSTTVAESIALHLQSVGLCPGGPDFDAIWFESDGEPILIGVLDCDVWRDSAIDSYRVKVGERTDKGFLETKLPPSLGAVSEKKFEVSLLDVYPIKDQSKKWHSLAVCLHHVRYLCRIVNSSMQRFQGSDKCSTVLTMLRSLSYG